MSGSVRRSARGPDVGSRDDGAPVVGLVPGRGPARVPAPVRSEDQDPLDELTGRAGLGRRDVAVLRAYRQHRAQVDPAHRPDVVDRSLLRHPALAASLVALWRVRLSPVSDGAVQDQGVEADGLALLIDDGIAAVDDATDRAVLDGLRAAMAATVATNHFHTRGALALVMEPGRIPGAGGEGLHRETFVVGRGVEGVHLRAGPVARGGIRASDRRHDYRAEVLALVRTQVRKNAVIVPAGAKGAFVAVPSRGEPADLRQAYRDFVGALLDVTERHPPAPGGGDGVGHDTDWYLAVAPDKGTAHLSDEANALARQRGYWLGDATASGGSTGYDHRELGITARGVWVGIEAHLRRLGRDPDGAVLTVVGVGDMSGDVFGNGMLQSDRIRLVAAFDHRHVFIDPDPDPVTSHRERRRLFGLSGSSWADYDPTLLSAGGAVHRRQASSVPVSEEAAAALGIPAGTTELTPEELIRALLRAPVDILYFGGIGTYVRAGDEEDAEVGDPANALVRILGEQIRARIVAEGANLAMTPQARVEAALHGVRLNSDAVDNAAGVICSDREVNLKILLGLAVETGRIDRAERDAILERHEDDVVADVLSACARLHRTLDRMEDQDPDHVMAALHHLVLAGDLEPTADGLPTGADLEDRRRSGSALVRPELTVVMAGLRRHAVRRLAATARRSPDEEAAVVARAFPPAVARSLEGLLEAHPLRRELATSIVANEIVDRDGVASIEVLADPTGADPDRPEAVRTGGTNR